MSLAQSYKIQSACRIANDVYLVPKIRKDYLILIRRVHSVISVSNLSMILKLTTKRDMLMEAQLQQTTLNLHIAIVTALTLAVVRNHSDQ